MKDTIAVAHAKLAPWLALFNNGSLKFYSGTQPANPDTALSGNTDLADIQFAASAFGSITDAAGLSSASAAFVAGTVNINGAATVTGTICSFARAFEADGVTVIGDFTVGTTGTDVIIGNALLLSGASLTVTSFTLSQPYH